jgi:hypothetical protein
MKCEFELIFITINYCKTIMFLFRNFRTSGWCLREYELFNVFLSILSKKLDFKLLIDLTRLF